VQLDSDELQAIFLREANEDQLTQPNYFENDLFHHADVLISIRAPENTRTLASIDPAKQSLAHKARHPGVQTYMRRAAEGVFKWVVTQFPCRAFAQDSEMSLSEYEDFVYAATFADQADPLAAWLAMEQEQARLVDFLAGKQQLTIRGADIEMTLSIAGRPFINCCGKNNMPDGEIFTAPVEDSVNGWVRFTYPAVREGKEVHGIELRFEDGRVTQATAKKNEEYLLTMLNSDEGARTIGEFAIATNHLIQRFSKQILYDEKIGGTLHMALGAGYPESGSKNHSALHWDMICDMHQSEILADGELLYRNGQFVV
jgi:aminopeptidase